MILSDRSLREAIEAGRIVVDPFDPTTVQPSSIDVRVDRLFRVFRNHTAGDHRRQAGPHRPDRARRDRRRRACSCCTPASSCSARRSSGSPCPTTSSARIEGKSSLGRLGPADPLDGRVHRRRLRRARHARAGQRGQPADHDLPGHEDRPDQLHGDDHAGRPARTARARRARSTRASAARRRAATSRTSADARAVAGVGAAGSAAAACRGCAVSTPTSPGWARRRQGQGLRATSTRRGRTARRPTTSPGARRS